MMTSELESLPADLEEGEIDDEQLRIAGSDNDGAAEVSSSSTNKRRSKRKSSGSSNSKVAKKAKVKKSKDSATDKSSRRRSSSKHQPYEDLDQPPHQSSASQESNRSLHAVISTPDELIDYSTEDEYQHEEDDNFQGPVDLNVAIQEPSVVGKRPHRISKAIVVAKTDKGSRKWSYQRRRPTKDRKSAPTVHEPPSCMFYMKGRCNKGDNCPFSHAVQPPKKPQLCKFYASGACFNNNDCSYMHSEFPCKFHHLGGFCRLGPECRFSHEPLSAEQRTLLLEGASADDKQPGATDNDHSVNSESASEAEVPHQPEKTEPERPVSLLGPAPKLSPHQQFPSAQKVENSEDSEQRHPYQEQQQVPLNLQPHPVRQMPFPPRPFPHIGDAENRNLPHHQPPSHLQPPSNKLPPPHPQQRLPLVPAPAFASRGSLHQRPAYSGSEPPARPFPSAPTRGHQHRPQLPLPPPPPSPHPAKPTPAAVAAASRALDAVASLLSEYCASGGFHPDVGEDAAGTDASVASPVAIDTKPEGVEDSKPAESTQQETDSDSDENNSLAFQRPVLVFRAPPVCKRKFPWRLIPLDTIKRLPYSMMPFPSSVLTGNAAGTDPRLAARQQQQPPPQERAASLLDPRINSRPEVKLEESEAEAEAEASKSGSSVGRLELNERSAAVRQASTDALSLQQRFFDPRFRRRGSQQRD